MVAIPTKEGRRRRGAGQGNDAKEVEEGHSQCTPASGIGQGEREHWEMAVEDEGRWRSTEVSAADASGRRRTLTKHSAFEER
jgi:hypothetical protein